MGLVYGVGINDLKYPTKINGKRTKEYTVWRFLLSRCYDSRYKEAHPSYIGCSMSENFKNYSYFYEWCRKQSGWGIDGYQIDKDILIKGNNTYHEDFCIIIPQEINNTFISRRSFRGCNPIGVTFNKKTGKYHSGIGVSGEFKNLGSFDCPAKAFDCYKIAKESRIKFLAEKYKDSISKKAYDALMNYQVEITD